MERDFHGCSPVWRTTYPGSLVRSDPELQDSSLSFNILLRRRRGSSLMVDNGNMSIQASIKRFKSNDNLPIHLTISMLPLLARVN